MRPKFNELPAVNTSGWYGLYAGYDPDVKLVGLHKAMFNIKSTNKKIRYNLQRILKRDAGTYSVIEGSGDLEPFTNGKKGNGASASWTWGASKLAGLPISSIIPRDGEHEKRAVLLAQIQLELTNISTQSSVAAEPDSEAMEFNLSVESLLTGEVNRSEDQGKLYVVPIPPPTEDDGLSGDYSNSEDIGMVWTADDIEFPGGHVMSGRKNVYFCYTRPDGATPPANEHVVIPELDKAGLWGEFFKLPFPILQGLASENTGAQINCSQTCPYGRIGKTTTTDGNVPAGTYVMCPQFLNVMDINKVFSVQADNYENEELNYTADAILYPANSIFPYEGINPGSSSTDVVVDGVSLTDKKGKGVGYKIHRNLDRQLRSTKSNLIPMPPPDAKSFLGGMPIEMVTERGISHITLIRGSRELRNFWKDLCQAIVAVKRVIVDVAEAVSRDAGTMNAGAYYLQYDECVKQAGRKGDTSSTQPRNFRKM
jgi:hypothetical protein